MRALREGLPDDLYGALLGSSDSETLFLLTVAAMRDGASMADALAATARLIYQRLDGEEAQLNMLITNGRTVAAIRSGSVLITNSFYVAEHPPFAPGGVVLVSEAPEAGAVWTPIDGHSWIEVDSDGSVRAEPLFLD
jgi:predicted glutamine amidotransferase